MLTICDYLSLSVKECKRLGFFRPGYLVKGSVKWQISGEDVVAITFATDMRGEVPLAVAEYTYKGANIREEIELRFCPSNMVTGSGYYVFVCPRTGEPCRRLYFVKGRFICRSAFRPRYPAQVEGPHTRRKNAAFNAFAIMTDCKDARREPGRKMIYRGKPTRYAKRIEARERRAYRLFAER